MTAGDECTNYAAYVESAVFGVPTPGYLLGNAGSWPGTAAAHGAIVNGIPSVGAVAEWDPGSSGIPWPGHVGVVEQVGPHDRYIVVSQQHVSGTDDYLWMRIDPSNPGNGWEQWPSHFIHFRGTRIPAGSSGGAGTGGGGPSSTALAPAGLAADGGFNSHDGGGWRLAPHSNFAIFGPRSGTRPYEGNAFGATNTSRPGGGIYEQFRVTIRPGESLCADAEVITVGRRAGGRGALEIWFLGGPRGTRDQSTGVPFSGLGAGDAWRPVATCLTSHGPHSVLRVQVAPAPHGPTIGVDAIDLHQSLVSDGGFDKNGGGGWRVAPHSNFALVYGRAGVTRAYEGNGFAATNTTFAGGGLYEDIHVPVAAGTSVCADAEVTTARGNGGGGAQGALTLWFIGGAHRARNASSSSAFGPLPGGDSWTPVRTCLTAPANYSAIRVQFYDTPRTPTLGVDAVDVHGSLVADGGFVPGRERSWHVAAHSGFAIYGRPGRGSHHTAPYQGSSFAATNASRPGGGIYEDIKATVLPGQSYCAKAEVVTAGAVQTGAAGTMGLFFIGGRAGTRTQSSAVSFGPLPGGDAWRTVTTCLTATAAHSDIRIQFYPDPHHPTLGIDTVDVR
jgi:hypothetical protein